MEEILLEAQKREKLSKSNLKSSRNKGLIPAVVYGAEEKTVPLFIKEKDINKILHKEHGTNILIKLKYDNTSKTVLIKEVQKNVINNNLLHLDFQIVSLKKEIEIDVPIHVKGEAPGVKTQGGILEHITREIRVKCLPTDIPKSIELDVSSLNIGDSILVKDLKLPPKVVLLSDMNSMVVNVVAPKKEEALASGLAEEPAEPEVIAKGKKEISEEEAAGQQAPGKASAPVAVKSQQPAGKAQSPDEKTEKTPPAKPKQ